MKRKASLTPKKCWATTRARMKKALSKLRERPQKLEDFTDPTMKLRFAFQQMLKKVSARDPSAPAKTPNEILKAGIRRRTGL